MEVPQILNDHWSDARCLYDEHNIVCLALQGSQNYGLNTESSDVDSKLLVTPPFYNIAVNKKADSWVYIRHNEEHIDCKDIRLYLDLFKHQNPNFLEILFTPYYYVPGQYAEEWEKLVKFREDIAHSNPYRNAEAIYGMMMQKYHALEHPYPSKLEVIEKFGYDPKQLCHLMRMEEFLERYVKGETYEACLKPEHPDVLKRVKQGWYDLHDAREIAGGALKLGAEWREAARRKFENLDNERVKTILDTAQYNIMRISVKGELLQ